MAETYYGGVVASPGIWTPQGIAGVPGRMGRIFPTRRSYLFGTALFRQNPRDIQITIKGDPNSIHNLTKLFSKMADRYKLIVWSEFKNAIPELHAKAGEYAMRSQVPWHILGRYAMAETIPRNQPSSISQVGPAVSQKSNASYTVNMGTRFIHPNKIGSSFGSEQMIPGTAMASGQFKGGDMPVGFGFKLTGADLEKREAYMEGASLGSTSGKRDHLWHNTYGAQPGSGWAIPQPGFEGAYLGPSPWFTGANWRNKAGHKYPHINWLWREELGLADSQTFSAVKEALDFIGGENWWPVPEYTKQRMAGIGGPTPSIGGLNVGLHWVPPQWGNPDKHQLQLGPGIMPKFFMRAATIEMTETVARRCMKKLGEVFQSMCDQDKTNYNRIASGLKGGAPGLAKVNVSKY